MAGWSDSEPEEEEEFSAAMMPDDIFGDVKSQRLAEAKARWEQRSSKIAEDEAARDKRLQKATNAKARLDVLDSLRRAMMRHTIDPRIVSLLGKLEGMAKLVKALELDPKVSFQRSSDPYHAY